MEYKIPTYLKHRPVYVVENYNQVDGKYAGDDSDAKGLSCGWAQWNQIGGGNDLSAKVWRYTGEKWSRQSEELPLHRVLDLTLMILNACAKAKGVECDVLGLKLNVCEYDGKPLNPNAIDSFNRELQVEEDEYLSVRFKCIAEILEKIGY